MLKIQDFLDLNNYCISRFGKIEVSDNVRFESLKVNRTMLKFIVNEE